MYIYIYIYEVCVFCLLHYCTIGEVLTGFKHSFKKQLPKVSTSFIANRFILAAEYI